MRAPCIVLILVMAGCSGDRLQKYLASGDKYMAAHRYAEAAIQFENATRIDPGSVVAHTRLGDVYARSGSWRAAAAAFGRACSLTAHDAEPCVRAAAAAMELRDDEAAIRYAKQALSFSPSSVEAHLALARAFLGLLRFADAEREVRSAMSL